MKNLIYIYEQYPNSEIIGLMKTRFIEINEKATGFLFKNIIHGDLKKENSLSAKEDEKYVGFKKQSTLLWSLVNSDKEDDK